MQCVVCCCCDDLAVVLCTSVEKRVYAGPGPTGRRDRRPVRQVPIVEIVEMSLGVVEDVVDRSVGKVQSQHRYRAQRTVSEKLDILL